MPRSRLPSSLKVPRSTRASSPAGRIESRGALFGAPPRLCVMKIEEEEGGEGGEREKIEEEEGGERGERKSYQRGAGPCCGPPLPPHPPLPPRFGGGSPLGGGVVSLPASGAAVAARFARSKGSGGIRSRLVVVARAVYTHLARVVPAWCSLSLRPRLRASACTALARGTMRVYYNMYTCTRDRAKHERGGGAACRDSM